MKNLCYKKNAIFKNECKLRLIIIIKSLISNNWVDVGTALKVTLTNLTLNYANLIIT